MKIIEDDKGYKKICIWKDNELFCHVGEKRSSIRIKGGESAWYNGTICMEVKLHPRHISNYAMICMRYTMADEKETEVIMCSRKERIPFKSQVLPCERCIYIGLLKEFEEAIEDYFHTCPRENLPNGRIEILYGGFDEVGSSKVSFTKAMELLIFIFQHIDRVCDEEMKMELLKLM